MQRILVAFAVGVLQSPVVGHTQDESGFSRPRIAAGHPDLRGVWQVLNSAVWNLEDHGAELGVPAGQSVVVGGEIPYRPSAQAQRAENYENRITEDTEAKCFMVGVPRITYMPYPFQIVQTADQVTILYEYVHTFRNIKIDSEHPPGPIHWWMGDSRGHWEGDTFVVDVIHFTDQTWFDRSGNYHSTDIILCHKNTNIFHLSIFIDSPNFISHNFFLPS